MQVFKSINASSWTFSIQKDMYLFVCPNHLSLDIIGKFRQMRLCLNLSYAISDYPPLKLHVALFSPNMHSLEGNTLVIGFFSYFLHCYIFKFPFLAKKNVRPLLLHTSITFFVRLYC